MSSRTVAVGLVQALGLGVLAGAASPDPGAAGVAVSVTVGAGSLALVASNLLVVHLGRHRRALGLPRAVGRAGIVLGALGLGLGALLTVVGAPTGLAERVAIDAFVLWQLLAGVALLRRCRTPRSAQST